MARRASMRIALVLALVAALAACKKKEEPKPPAAQAPAQATAPAVAPAARGDILGAGVVESFDELINAVQPYLAAMGASMATIAGAKAQIGRWIGLASWEGVEGTRPLRFWLLNPKKYRPPILTAIPMQKGKTLQTNGWATEAVGDYALVAKDAGTIAAVRPLVAQELGSPAGPARARSCSGAPTRRTRSAARSRRSWPTWSRSVPTRRSPSRASSATRRFRSFRACAATGPTAAAPAAAACPCTSSARAI